MIDVDQLKVGDTVRLLSGGPNMTVTYTEGDAKVTCTWFFSNEPKPFFDTFAPEALEKT